MQRTPKGLKSNAQALRRNMTREERRLWYDFLKNLSITVKRQYVFAPYIVDFYVPSVKVVIELDGQQHYEDKQIKLDADRTEYLQNLGLAVLRYSNREVNQNFEGVCMDILRHLPSDVKTKSTVYVGEGQINIG